MTNLNNSLNRRLLSHSSIAILLLVFALLGFVDATYLAFKYYTNTVPPCTFVDGCEEVTTSAYAAIGGVSVALIGAINYLVVLLGVMLFFDTKKQHWLRRVSYWTWIGFLGSLYFVYLQLFIIQALCAYCLFSAFTSVALFILGRIYLRERTIEQDS